MKDYADQLRKVLITAPEICTILYIIRKPNSNNSKFLTSFPPRIRSSKHLPVSRHSLRLWTDCIFHCIYSSKSRWHLSNLTCSCVLGLDLDSFSVINSAFSSFHSHFLEFDSHAKIAKLPRRCLFVWMIVYWQYTFIDVRVTCTSVIV